MRTRYALPNSSILFNPLKAKKPANALENAFAMYEVRCTMYDCDYSARCAGFSRAGASGMFWSCDRGRRQTGSAYVRCTTVAPSGAYVRCTRYDVRRWRLAAPMYDVRRTMYDLGSSRALRGDTERMRAGCLEAVIGRGYKGTGGGGG